MACNLVLKRSFPELESCLLHDLETPCGSNPFSRKWVLTSSGTLARHIQHRLEKKIEASSSLTLGGLRIVSLSYFASELYKKVSRKVSAYKPPLNEILLDTLVQQLPDSSPLVQLKSIDNGYLLLSSTFRDLADAGFGTEDAGFFLDAVRESGVSDRERAIVELYLEWIEEVGQQDTAWSPLGQQFLARWIEQATEKEAASLLSLEDGAPCELFIHGFYDFTDNNLQMISGLSRLLPVTLYFPDNRKENRSHPAFDFSAEVLENIRLRTNSNSEENRPFTVPVTENGVADYLDRTFPEGNREKQPGFISFQKASSPRAEAISAALQARNWIDNHDMDPEDIMVVFTSPGGYLRPVRDAFSAFCIPVNMVDCPVEMSGEKRKLSVLKNLWKEEVPAEWIFHFLRDNPGFCGKLGLDSSHFESELRKINFGGSFNWEEIKRLAGTPAENLSRLPQLTEPELELVDLIIDTWVVKPDFPIRPETACELVEKISFWTEGEETHKEVMASFARMSGQGSGTLITESLFLALVFDSARDERTGGDVSLPGVKLIPMMRARGLTCRAMIFMGLSSGVFPKKAEEDYFLGDATRSEVARRARDLGHHYRLPVKTRLTDEMLLLFYLLNSSAEKVHWIVPETDGEGRLVAPTSWIQSYLQEWGASQPGRAERIPPGPAEQALYLMNREPSGGASLPPEYAFLLGSGFNENLFKACNVPDFWQNHSSSGNEVPEFFGVVNPASYPEQRESLRVTNLEKLARCPYMFFAELLLNLEALEAQDLPFGLSPMEKGSLVHSCLERIFSNSTSVLEALQRFLRKPGKVEAVVEQEMRKNPGLRLFPAVLLRAMHGQLAGVILNYLRYAESAADEGWVVESLEHQFIKPYPKLPGLNVSGTADRIDREDSTGHLRVIDYKSGKNSDVSKSGKNYTLNLGWRAQAALYPWMSGETEDGTETSFSYIFLGEEDKKEIPVKLRVSGEELLESLSSILENGLYIPVNKRLMEDLGFPYLDPCQYCGYRSMCRKADPAMMVKSGVLFKQLCRDRTEAMRMVSGEKAE